MCFSPSTLPSLVREFQGLKTTLQKPMVNVMVGLSTVYAVSGPDISYCVPHRHSLQLNPNEIAVEICVTVMRHVWLPVSDTVSFLLQHKCTGKHYRATPCRHSYMYLSG